MARYLLLFLILITLSYTSPASDLSKEKRWAEQIEDALLDGEPVTLNDGVNDFLAIDTAAENPNSTAIILLHGIGIHPDWPQVINPLRIGLPESGWRTLSLQLPVLPNDASAQDYQPLMKEVPGRIDAGIKYLQSNGSKKVIIVAHSMGAEMASYYLAQAESSVAGYIGIGMGPGNSHYLEKIGIPILDLYGGEDLPAVLESAIHRGNAARTNTNYTQRKITAADHFFDEQEAPLLEAVTKWLRTMSK